MIRTRSKLTVAEYWIADPDGRTVERAREIHDEVLESPLLPGLRPAVGQMFD